MLLVAVVTGFDGGQSPTLFGPGTISTPAPEFAITFSVKGDEVFFNRATPDRRSMVIMTARLVDGRWTSPTVAPFSGTYLDVDPFIAPDGRRLYFSSNRPRGQGKGGDFNTWYVERTGQGWGSPIDPGAPLNSDSSDIFVSEARDGTIAFSSSRRGASRVYLARRTSTGWTVPEPIAFGTLLGGGNPLIDPEGRFILLVAPAPTIGPTSTLAVGRPRGGASRSGCWRSTLGGRISRRRSEGRGPSTSRRSVPAWFEPWPIRFGPRVISIRPSFRLFVRPCPDELE